MNLSEKKILKLNSFCGTGNFKNAEIIFMGNEEGLDGDKIETVIEDRSDAVKTNIKITSDYLDGHYRIRWNTNSKKDGKSQMINYQCRLIKFLYDEGNHNDWFLEKGIRPDIDKILEDYRVNSLYRESGPGEIVTALTELRPLPRKNESVWSYLKIDKFQYLKAVGFSSNRGLHQDYIKFRENRFKVLKNLFNHCENLKLIIGIGDQKSKEKFFKSFGADIVFEPVPSCNNKLIYSSTQFNGKSAHIYLSKFFGNGHMSLIDLKSIASIIKKHFS